MNKIGIVTLFTYENYGNRLQMYAVQKVYKKLGFDSEILKYKLPTQKDPFIIQLKVFIAKLFLTFINLVRPNLKNMRLSNFKKHAKIHYTESNNFINPLKINKDFHEKYHFLSVGSDQIWGWFTYPMADFVFLKFAPKEKRITFSPSFGYASLDKKYHSIFTNGLEGFENISVREESGAKIVRQLIDKESCVLCDPTMCLSKADWLDFATVHQQKPKKKFLLTYFLGESSPTVLEILKQIQNDFEIVNLNSLDSPKYYAIDPSEWVDYINSAELFLTDSFHGVVFSIVLQTPFAVYSRVGGESMQTRITNILEKFNFEERFELKDKLDNFLIMDFSKAQEIIEIEKCKVETFLKESLAL